MKRVAHVCPHGLEAEDRLEREGFPVVDHVPPAREEADRCDVASG